MTGRLPAEVWPVAAGGLWSSVVVVAAWRRRPPACVRAIVRRSSSDHRDGSTSEPDQRWAGVGGAVVAAATWLGAGGRRLLGRPEDPVADRRAGVAGLAGVAVGAIVPWLGVVVGSAAWAAPWVVSARATRRHRDAVLDEVPDVVDLLRLALGAGYSLRLALEAVAGRATGTVGEALGRVRLRLARGQRLADALGELESLGEAGAPLFDALAAAERHGAPLLPRLARLSADGRATRRRRAEERARRVPIKLLFPLVFCTLPAFGLLTVVPFLASALGRLSF